MRPLFAVLIFAAALSQASPPLDTRKQHEASTTKQQGGGTVKLPPPEGQPRTYQPENTTRTETDKWPEKPPWWDVAWSTWGLTLIGFFGTIAAIWTLFTIRRQTRAIETQLHEIRNTGLQTDRLIEEATRQSIEAKKSANALINSERAWLDGEFIHPQNTQNEYRIYPRFDLLYVLRITNHGKTPAQILSWEILFDSRGPVTTADQRETWSSEIRGDLHELLAAGHDKVLPYAVDPPTSFYEWGAVETGSKSGICKVTIKYLDLITLLDRAKSEPPRETSFRCLWDVANRQFIRLPNYNYFS